MVLVPGTVELPFGITGSDVVFRQHVDSQAAFKVLKTNA